MRRPLADRVALRFPGLTPLATRIIFRLRPGSQLRRRLLVHYVGQSTAAMNRRDFDVYLLGWDTDVELEFSGDITMTGLATSYRGHDGYRAFWDNWLRDWEQVSHEITALIDLGDRLLLRIVGHHSAPRSGLWMESDSGALLEYRDGWVMRCRVWFHWRDALEALGLKEPD